MKSFSCWLGSLCLALLPILSWTQGLLPPVSPTAAPAVPALLNMAFAGADYNGDSFPDIFYAGETALGLFESYLLRNDSGTVLTSVAHPFPPLTWGSASWGDLNSDGLLDLALCGRTANSLLTQIYTQDNNGSFSLSNQNLPPVWRGTLDWIDLDQDGDEDLFLTGRSDQGLLCRAYENTGGTLTLRSNTAFQGLEESSADFGDYDQDGDLDIVVAGLGQDGLAQTMVYRNQGNLSFDRTFYDLPGVHQGSVQFGDLEGDGDLDLLLCGQGLLNHTFIFRYVPDHYAQVNSLPLIANGVSLWGDYDGDLDLDLVQAGISPGLSPNPLVAQVIEGTGNNQFQNNPSPLVQITEADAAWLDLDLDGDLDLFLTGRAGNGAILSLWYRNDASIFKY